MSFEGWVGLGLGLCVILLGVLVVLVIKVYENVREITWTLSRLFDKVERLAERHSDGEEHLELLQSTMDKTLAAVQLQRIKETHPPENKRFRKLEMD